ncbi:hypothetical protein, partial [Actinoplanes auranticolor]|uniref:hypothetical protein n=1 Tax=Actinoplanes auranticolor TaxID=47988 RepID=UPI001BB398E4
MQAALGRLTLATFTAAIFVGTAAWFLPEPVAWPAAVVSLLLATIGVGAPWVGNWLGRDLHRPVELGLDGDSRLEVGDLVLQQE